MASIKEIVKGKVPIPEPYRKELDIKEGDDVLLDIEKSSQKKLIIMKIPKEIDLTEIVKSKLKTEEDSINPNSIGDEIEI